MAGGIRFVRELHRNPSHRRFIAEPGPLLLGGDKSLDVPWAFLMICHLSPSSVTIGVNLASSQIIFNFLLSSRFLSPYNAVLGLF